MPEEREKYDWIETLVKAGAFVGLNPIRIRWRLRSWQDRLQSEGQRTVVEARSVTHESKVCLQCGALSGAQDRTCVRCGARLPPRWVVVLHRALRRVDLGLTPETLLSVGFAVAYLATATRGDTSTLFDVGVVDLMKAGANVAALTASGEIWRLGTSLFLHGGAWHLGFNILALLYIMPFAREIYGSARTTLVFLLTGMAGAAASMAWGVGTDAARVSIGASGAISGLIGLALVWAIRRGPAAAGVRNAMLRWIAYTVLFGFFVGADNACHVGGWVSGGLLALAVPPHRPGQPASAAWTVLGWVSAVALLACFVIVVARAFGIPLPTGGPG